MKTADEIINNSGYPLQIRLAEWVGETTSKHKWQVLVDEHRWTNAETKEDGYIDLVLERLGSNLRLVIECKRILGSWTFLLPHVQSYPRQRIQILSSDLETSKYLWTEKNFYPESPEAEFCVMETDGKKDNRTLEKLSGELLLSLEYLAIEESELIKATLGNLHNSPANMLYLPVIVTTATVQTMNFNASSINPKNGEISNGIVAQVPFVRFRKNLATNIEYEKPAAYTLSDLNKENDRTVFVVHSESFIEFLSYLQQ